MANVIPAGVNNVGNILDTCATSIVLTHLNWVAVEKAICNASARKLVIARKRTLFIVDKTNWLMNRWNRILCHLTNTSVNTTTVAVMKSFPKFKNFGKLSATLR